MSAPIPTYQMPPVQRTHFCVIENTPGYLPEDDEPGIYATHEEAHAAALQLAAAAAATDDDEFAVPGVITHHTPNYIEVTYPESPTALPRVITIVPTQEVPSE